MYSHYSFEADPRNYENRGAVCISGRLRKYRYLAQEDDNGEATTNAVRIAGKQSKFEFPTFSYPPVKRQETANPVQCYHCDVNKSTTTNTVTGI